MSENSKKSIDLELDEATAQGHYANLAIISHSASEFVLDFAAIMPGVPKAKIKSRIVLSLQDNITKYESAVGRIDIHMPQSAPDDLLALGFTQGEA